MEKRQLLGTTTIVIVMFTIIILGGATMPLVKFLEVEEVPLAKRRWHKDVTLSKTEKMVWKVYLILKLIGKMTVYVHCSSLAIPN